jgi:CPA2 family monovalent cation:H+ antiporter-2
VAAIFLSSSWLWKNTVLSSWFNWLNPAWQASAFWATTLLVALPFVVATWRKMKALGMLLAEMGVNEKMAGKYTVSVRSGIANLLPIFTLIVMMVLVSALSASMLPPFHLLLFVLAVIAFLAYMLRDFFVRLHSRLQIAIRETLENPQE